MARLLVKAQDYINSDISKDIAGSYKRGDVVTVLPDGHVFGNKEGPPAFRVVDLPGPPEDYHYLCSEDNLSLRESVPRSALKLPKLKRLLSQRERPVKTRRRHKINLDDTNQILDKRIS